MLVLHFSRTPLAGMPIRLCQAQNRHLPLTARLVDSSRFGLFDHDVVFDETPELAVDLARKADIVHLHNYLDLDSDAFAPIDFRDLVHKGAAVVRQFHSTPDLVAQVMGITPQALLAQPIPSLVIAQYPERLYPDALVVPNFVFEDDPACQPSTSPPLWDVFYSYTKDIDAWTDRWNTKGAPQTLRMLDTLAKDLDLRVRTVTDRPLAEVLADKRRSRIALDDMVTGSYHLTGLEALAQGVPVLSCLDERSQALLRRFSGADWHPFINTRLEEAPKVIAHLAGEPELCRALGLAGRRWLLAHWREERMVGHYQAAYDLLLEDPALVRRQPLLALDGPDRIFATRTLPDLVHTARGLAYEAGAEAFWKGWTQD
ncbi:hypothetical protein JCM15519_29290 [Fundidesulfovibrio butyratiphilus]